MTNAKISALTSATTPLAGTEVLPIVQSSTTKQVSIANVTAGRLVDLKSFNLTDTSNPYGQWIWTNGTARSYYLEGAGNLARLYSGNLSAVVQQWDVTTGATRINYPLTVADNVIQATAAKGINFTANTPAAGMTSQLLNWYEEGTWTPTVTSTIGSITAYTSSGKYTRIGKQVTYSLAISISNNGTGAGRLRVTGLPFALTRCNGCGFEGAATGLMLSVSTFSSTTLEINTYNYLYAGGTGYSISATATDII